MDFALIFPLVLVLISSGQSRWEETTMCHKRCPAGTYQSGDCSCKNCPEDSFTDIENSKSQCLRCTTCGAGEVEIKKCTTTNDTVCACASGHYKEDSSDGCKKCESSEDSDDPKGKHELNRRTKCQSNPECKGNCKTTPTTITTPPLVSVTLVEKESISQLLWLLPLVVAISTGLLWLLLFLTKHLLRNRGCCLIWRVNKHPAVEDSIRNEPHRHQGSNSNTMTLHVCEETPMMPLSQAPTTPAHPAHPGCLLLDYDRAEARLEEQPDRWPAIVLYTIIRAVPVRRWKEFLRLLSVADHQLERVELEAGPGQSFMERQYQMLRLWSQRSSAALTDVVFALCYMELPGCAQLLQESLEKLEWRPEPNQRGPTTCGLPGALQDA